MGVLCGRLAVAQFLRGHEFLEHGADFISSIRERNVALFVLQNLLPVAVDQLELAKRQAAHVLAIGVWYRKVLSRLRMADMNYRQIVWIDLQIDLEAFAVLHAQALQIRAVVMFRVVKLDAVVPNRAQTVRSYGSPR